MVDDQDLKRWFVDAVLPLEAALERYISRNGTASDEVVDIRQEVYERALRGSKDHLPMSARSFVFSIARNVLIDRARRAKVVSFEQLLDREPSIDNLDYCASDRHLEARDQLRRAIAGLEHLPARCREVVRLRKIEGLSIQETALRMKISHHTVERQLTLGMRALTDFMLGGSGHIERNEKIIRKSRL